MQALPEAVERQAPSPELKVRLMAEVRADVAAERAQRADRAAPRARRVAPGIGEWLRGLHIGGLT